MKKKTKKTGKGKRKRGLKFTDKPKAKKTKKKINLDFATKPKDRRRKKREEVEYYYYDDFQKKEKDEESNKDKNSKQPFNDEDYIFYSMSQEALVKKFIEKEKFYNISKEVKNEVSQERLNSNTNIK